ncbi:hypothetical protein PsYK624_054560 [Phanerochaete sordida]|uniref:Uncharacterized protein n=1 Tax=Phanerochaete sordida TaxID=48140 RepID=A0A9P3G787_9APHY|nr:hypothetical protein PsYK624_054560 [Phanerochaete sordida]
MAKHADLPWDVIVSGDVLAIHRGPRSLIIGDLSTPLRGEPAPLQAYSLLQIGEWPRGRRD